MGIDTLKMSAPADAADPLRSQVRTQSRANATDFRQFAELRRNARADDPATLREVARQFESIFTKMMLESMRSASFGDPLFGSDQGDMYQDMMDDQLAVEMSQGRGLGLADMLIRQLSHGGAARAGESGAGQAPADDAAKRKFIDMIGAKAEAAGRALGVDPRAIIAQAALETGWGTAEPGDAGVRSHNLFGIKAGGTYGGPAVESLTTEYTAQGVAGDERARFRAYASHEQSVDDYVQILRDNPRYAAALGTGADVRAFATALQRGGYATDPEYANKLVAVSREVAERLGARQPVAAVHEASLKTEHPTPIPGVES
jgi:peptidoglycan hydrolase FlgJ